MSSRYPEANGRDPGGRVWDGIREPRTVSILRNVSPTSHLSQMILPFLARRTGCIVDARHSLHTTPAEEASVHKYDDDCSGFDVYLHAGVKEETLDLALQGHQQQQ